MVDEYLQIKNDFVHYHSLWSKVQKDFWNEYSQLKNCWFITILYGLEMADPHVHL